MNSVYDCLFSYMAVMQEEDRKAVFVVAGDANAHHTEWLQSVSHTVRLDIHSLDGFLLPVWM